MKIEYEIDWQDPEHLLKVCFPTQYSGTQARFGDPFGSSLRSQQPGKTYDEAQWEVAGSRYAMVTDDGEREGLFVVTEAKYGWTARAGNLGLSLLRSARMPTAGRAQVESEGDASAIFSDLGTHRIRIAVGRFDPGYPREALPAALAEHLFTPAIFYKGITGHCGLAAIEGGPTLLPSWAKPEANGEWTLRLHETLGRRGSANILLRDGYSCERLNLSGEVLPDQPKKGCLHFKPYELISLRIRRES